MADAAIIVEHVSKAVADRQLLSDVNFTIEPQSLVSLIGPNGAGKSTLVKIILGLDRHHEGTVTIGSNERIQYIPQLADFDHHQLPLSVHEYLSIGHTPLYSGKKTEANFVAALEHVGVDNNKLTQSFRSLSGGERQRIAIARALLVEPTILVLDEPLAAVDHHSRQGLYELIRHLQQQHAMTVLLVSHDIESVMPLSDKVLCLNTTLHQGCHPLEFQVDDTSKTVHHHC
jgi:zinc transport system ATP-binding protein